MSVPGPLGAVDGGTFELRTPALDTRTRSRSRLGVLALSGLLLTGLMLSISAARTDALLPESVRPIPSSLAGAFGTSGFDLHSGGLVAVLVLSFACYVIAVREAERVSARMVLMGIAGLHALVLLAPPLLSTDIFSYQAYARMGSLYGANPYLHGPEVIALDPVYPFIGAKWVTTPTVYGPVFTIFSYALAPVSIAASAVAYKAIAALASLVTVTLVWNTARLRGVEPAKAAALVGLNPLIYGVGGGHNDLLMLALAIAGLSFAVQRRDRTAGASLAVATGIKLTGGLMLPFALAGLRRTRERRRDILIGAGVAAAVITAASIALFGGGTLQLFSTVQHVQSEGDWHSIPGFIGTELGLGGVGHVVGTILTVAFLAASGWLLRQVWRGEQDWIAAAGWATATMLLTAGSLLPWYVAWLMPLAALGRDSRLWRSAITITGVVLAIQLLGYFPRAISALGL